jgi:hypothetical protein
LDLNSLRQKYENFSLDSVPGPTYFCPFGDIIDEEFINNLFDQDLFKKVFEIREFAVENKIKVFLSFI